MDDYRCRMARWFHAFKPTLKTVVAALLIAIPIRIGVGLTSPDVTAEQLRRLEQGEILVSVNQAEGPARGTVEAIILIDAPAEGIWKVMIDCDQIPIFIPGVEACEVLDSGENWEIIRHDVKWIWFFPRVSYVFRARYQPNRQILFTRISGDLREMRGSWQLIPAKKSNTTLVRYRVYLDPGFLIPQWLVRNALKSDLPAVLTALRTRVLSSLTAKED
jgi:ribosome-associated toxin RatA of RatAB toxin-antitoxin module